MGSHTYQAQSTLTSCNFTGSIPQSQASYNSTNKANFYSQTLEFQKISLLSSMMMSRAYPPQGASGSYFIFPIRKSQYKTETKTNPFVHSNFNGEPNPKVLADFVHINSVLKSKKSFIIDARSKAEYDGSEIRAAHAGHIPTAINIDWNDNLDHGGGVFKSYDKLGQMYSYIPKDAEVTTYCQGGYRAANSFVALKILGYKNVRMYLGSWGEWGNRLDLPAETKKPSGK